MNMRFFLLLIWCAPLLLWNNALHGQDGILIQEPFDDNSQSWQELNAGNITFGIAGGHYTIQNLSGREVIAERAVYINEAKDFHISCTVKQLKGSKRSHFGLVWGMKDFEHYYAFEISRAKVFGIYSNQERKFYTRKGWSQENGILGKDEYNTLEIKKENNDLSFFINGKKVYYRAADRFYGSKIGFIASQGTTIAVDRFSIMQEQEDIQVAPGLVFSTPKENLGKNINSGYKDSRPVLAANGEVMYFTRESHVEKGGARKRLDIWMSKLENGEWAPAVNAGEKLNNGQDNYVGAVTKDGNTLLVGESILTRRAFDVKVGTVTKTENGWDMPQGLQIKDFYANSPEASYFLSADGQKLLMALDRDDSYGSRDIYISFLEKDGTWSAPKNLGAHINTPADEKSAFLDADNETLYYATQGKPGYGSSDIFVTRRLDDTWAKWSEPQNLGPEVNSPGEENNFFIPQDGGYAYFDSNDGSYGSSDIFRIKLPVVKDTEEGMEVALESMEEQPSEAVMVTVSGQITNPVTGMPVAAEVIYQDMETGETIARSQSGKADGKYETVLPAGRQYKVVAQNPAFLSLSKTVDLRQAADQKALSSQTLHLLPTEAGQVFRLEHLFFGPNSAQLKEEAFAELAKLAIFLAQYPAVKIEVAGHADNTGSDNINTSISRQRAEAVTEYLVKTGISAARLSSKGYSTAQPLAGNDTEANRALNRRVEFRVVGDW